MRAGIPGAVVLWLLGCGSPMGMGGTPSDPGTPEAEYRTALNQYLANHMRMVGWLYRTQQPDFRNAAAYAQACVDELIRMKGLIQEPKRSELDPMIETYRRAAERLGRNQPLGPESKVDRWRHRVQQDFGIEDVTLVRSKAAGPPAETGPTPAPDASPHPAEADPPRWLYYHAWKALHAELAQRWSGGDDCRATYERLLETLRRWQADLPEDQRARMGTYIAMLQATHKDTEGFTRVRPGMSKEDVLNDLRALEKAINLYYGR